jgi:hypothetical protein
MKLAPIVLIALLASPALAQDKPWRPLFDGKTLTGWHHFGEGQWVVEDGAIVGRTQNAAKLYSLLISDAVYHDFTVRLKFKSIKGNSGFYIRTVFKDPDEAHGLQIEVDPRNNSGGIYESYRRAWVSRPEAEVYKKAFKPDDWNELEIDARGPNVTVKLNGVVTAKTENDPSRPAGQLAMQMHSGNDMLVYFKDIEIQGEPKKGEDKKAPPTPQKITQDKSGLIVLPARHCTISGTALAFMPEWDALGFWRAGESASWDVEVAKPGTYDVTMEWSVDQKNAGNGFVMQAGDSKIEGKVPTTGRWDVYKIKHIGKIELAAGQQKVVFRADGDFKTALMDLRELRLTPARAR